MKQGSAMSAADHAKIMLKKLANAASCSKIWLFPRQINNHIFINATGESPVFYCGNLWYSPAGFNKRNHDTD
jgi:hypothetical protein